MYPNSNESVVIYIVTVLLTFNMLEPVINCFIESEMIIIIDIFLQDHDLFIHKIPNKQTCLTVLKKNGGTDTIWISSPAPMQ